MEHEDVVPIDRRQREIFTLIHALANCHQAVIGYFELNEYERARTMALECKANWETLIQKLTEIIEDN